MKRKPIFQTVRSILGRGFRPAEVAQIDAAVDCATGEAAACEDLESGKTPSRIGPAGTALIKEFEGCARLRRDGLVEAYPDPGTGGDPWTIGWGATGPRPKRATDRPRHCLDTAAMRCPVGARSGSLCR